MIASFAGSKSFVLVVVLALFDSIFQSVYGRDLFPLYLFAWEFKKILLSFGSFSESRQIARRKEEQVKHPEFQKDTFRYVSVVQDKKDEKGGSWILAPLAAQVERRPRTETGAQCHGVWLLKAA
jgi:hypothetical protein